MKFDFHTHKLKDNSIVNLSVGDEIGPAMRCSVGIHPWDTSAGGSVDMEWLSRMAPDKCVVAIGEAGFDKIRGGSYEFQREVFAKQIALSERYSKPLIVHCVKAQAELLEMYRRCAPSQAWVVHGFRGKPESAMQLLNAGMYLSLGPRFNSSTAAMIPPDRLLLETDDSGADIGEVYDAVADVRKIDVAQLDRSVQSVLRSIGINPDSLRVDVARDEIGV